MSTIITCASHGLRIVLQLGLAVVSDSVMLIDNKLNDMKGANLITTLLQLVGVLDIVTLIPSS